MRIFADMHCQIGKYRTNLSCLLEAFGLWWFLHDWLEYHRHIGIDNFMVYDIDGSFSSGLEQFVQNGFVSYLRLWADRLSDSLGNITRSLDTPLCVELYAYAHCLISSFAVSDWVVLLHAPDEYSALSYVSTNRCGLSRDVCAFELCFKCGFCV